MKKFGDRKDGRKLKDIDPSNIFASYIMPKKVDAELHMLVPIEIGPLMDYLAEKKKIEGNDITFFNVILAAMVRLVAERPVLNRFTKNHNFYERNTIAIGYVGKVSMEDTGLRAIHMTHFTPETTVFDVAEKTQNQIKKMREGKLGGTNDVISGLSKKPKFIRGILFTFAPWLDKHGWVPKSFIKTDPNQSTIFVSNVGTIDTDAPFHHLNEWGTNSIFVCVGKAYDKLVLKEDGSVVSKKMVNFSFALDERITDGFYYAKSMHVLERILADPKQLEVPFVSPNQS